MSKKSNNFASNYNVDDPVGALAYTDFSIPSPVLRGKDAERFIHMMEENERKAAESAKKPMTVEEAKKQLSFEKIFLQMKEDELKEINERIKKLKEIIKNN